MHCKWKQTFPMWLGKQNKTGNESVKVKKKLSKQNTTENVKKEENRKSKWKWKSESENKHYPCENEKVKQNRECQDSRKCKVKVYKWKWKSESGKVKLETNIPMWKPKNKTKQGTSR